MGWAAGQIPESIGLLSNLRQLILRENYFQGSLPASLGQLSQLLVLDCRSNLLDGEDEEGGGGWGPTTT